MPVRTHACRKEIVEEPALELLDSSLCAALTRLPLEDYPGYEILEEVRFGLQAPIDIQFAGPPGNRDPPYFLSSPSVLHDARARGSEP